MKKEHMLGRQSGTALVYIKEFHDQLNRMFFKSMKTEPIKLQSSMHLNHESTIFISAV